MPNQIEFPFANARRISESEVIAAEKAVQEQFGISYSQRGKLTKNEKDLFLNLSCQTSIRLNFYCFFSMG